MTKVAKKRTIFAGGRIMDIQQDSFHETLGERFPKDVLIKDGNKVTVRPLKPEDKDDLYALFQAIPNGDRLFLKDDVSNQKVIDEWCNSINYDNILPLVALSDGKIVADGTLHKQRERWMRPIGKVRLVVHPEYRRRHIAVCLIEELIEIARDAGLNKLDAEFIAEQTGAIEAFRSIGFTTAAVLHDHVFDLKGQTHDFVILTYDLRGEEFYGAD